MSADTDLAIAQSEARAPYYAEAGMVWKHPVYTRTDTGLRISIGFPVCTMHAAAGAEAAAKVATLMNLGDAAEELIAALEDILNYTGGAEGPLNDDYVVDRAKAAIEKAKRE
jgi:hypothetical protein